MLSLSKAVFSPRISYQDKLMYMTSLGLYHSIGDQNGNNPMLMEQIFDLVTTTNTRYMGLQLLVLAFQQNPDNVCAVGRWPQLLYSIIKDSSGCLEKSLACKILSMIMPYMAEDSKYDEYKEDFVKEIFPFLLGKINENVEWADEASICLKASLKAFPKDLAINRAMLLSTILSQVTSCVSSKSFEVLAECFCHIPYCSKEVNPVRVKQRWQQLYLRTLKTLETLQYTCLSRLSSTEPYAKLNIDATEFTFPPDNEDDSTWFYEKFTVRVRRYVNLCKCLAKLISTQPKYSGDVSISPTLNCLIPLYRQFRKNSLSGVNEDVLYTFLPQMRLAGLVVVEALILNCNMNKEPKLLKEFLTMSLKSSTNTSSEIVSELRIATWKLVSLWLDGFGRNAAENIAEGELPGEIMNDVIVDTTEFSQANNTPQTHKSKKNTASNSCRKSVLKRKNIPRICEAALASLESFLYNGAAFIKTNLFKGLCRTIFQICETIPASRSFPFPYSEESCREKLYSVVMAITIVARPDEYEFFETAKHILEYKIKDDPSFKVRKIENKMLIISKKLLYPRRPLPSLSDIKQRLLPKISNETSRSDDATRVWISPHPEQMLEVETESETAENVKIKVESSFQNENEIHHEEEYMEVEQQYHEQVNENQCNGEDILEIQSSSQCQDDVDSDEEEEEEEEEERSYDDEEMNQEEHLQEMYIPSDRKSPLPIQINTVETVQNMSEPEYEECASSVKVEENAIKSSDKEICVNGEDNVIQEEEVPSSSAQTANENGIFVADDDDLDEENEEDEEEENETESLQVEKKEESVEPALKKQKVQVEDNDNVPEKEDGRATSPTLEEMKADFLKVIPSSSSVEEVNTEKSQMSISS